MKDSYKLRRATAPVGYQYIEMIPSVHCLSLLTSMVSRSQNSITRREDEDARQLPLCLR